MAGANLVWEKSTAGWLMIDADLVWEKNTAASCRQNKMMSSDEEYS